MPAPQSCVEALLIESGLSLPYAFRYKKPGFLPRTPLPPLEWAVQLFMWDGTVRWNLLCLFRVTGGRLSPKFCSRALAGQGQNFADRLLAHTEQASAHTPKKTEEQEMVRLRLQPMHYRDFWNVQWEEHPGMVLVANPDYEKS